MLLSDAKRDAVIIAIYFVALPLIVVCVIRTLAAMARKRTRAFQVAAARIGFVFEGDNWHDSGRAPLLETPLFEKGDRHYLRNILSGERDGSRISIFDYKFVEGRGRGSRHYSQTVSTFSRTDLCLPDFELRPAQLLDKTLGALTHTRSLISFVDTLDPQRKWHIEGTGNTLAVYQFRKRISPGDVPTFLDETSSIARAFLIPRNAAV